MTDDEVAHFRGRGYVVLDDVLDRATVRGLLAEAGEALAWQEQAMRDGQRGVEALNQLGHRYFIPRRSALRPVLRDLVLGVDMAHLLGPVVGTEAYLFIDVFVHKAPSRESAFAWHQDHGYLAHFGFGDAPPNVTVWTPLVDVDEQNGALVVLPFREGVPPTAVPHRLDPRTQDCVADVDEPGVCLPMRAGSLLVMHGHLLHRSGANQSDLPRPAYQWQYGPEPLLADGRPISLVEPFLRDGMWVGSPSRDGV